MFMLTIAIILLALTVLSIALIIFGGENHSFLPFFFGSIGAVCALIGLIFSLCLAYDWFAASHKARILNSEYGTQYTREDVFYASSVIDTMRELDRQRVELNGDLLQQRNGK